MNEEFKRAIFLEECKNRFLCKVKIDEHEELCYLSSSSKLTPFIKLAGREVILKKNLNTKSKTRYTLHAVRTPEGYVLVNLGYVNSLLKEEFLKCGHMFANSTIYAEKIIDNLLKVDFLIESDTKIIVEAKGLITESSTAYLPSMKVERAISQLKALKKLLDKGYGAHYCLILMNPNISRVKLDKTNVSFYRLFRACLKRGMQVFIYKTMWQNETVFLCRSTSTEYTFG